MTANAMTAMANLSVDEGSQVAAPTVGPPIQPAKISTVYCIDDLQGIRALRSLGIVRGVTVRSRNVAASIGAGFKSLMGGEISTFTGLCEEGREQALMRMLEHAAERGANGVVGVRYDTNAIAQGMTEVIAYGMAVSDEGAPSEAWTLESGDRSASVCTSNEIPGYTMNRSLGLVQGMTVRSRNVFATIGAGLKSLAGGEITAFTKMCEDARLEAYTRMLAEAVALGADGIVAVRYSTGEVVEGVTEVLAYGTAVSSTLAAAPAPTPDAGVSALMITTSNRLPGLNVQGSLGIAQGLTVRSSNVFANIGASFKTLVGGEISTWTDMCQATRKEAFDRLVSKANEMGAKGIVAFRYDTNQVNGGVVEVVAYGTAVSDVVTVVAPQPPGCLLPHVVSTDLEIIGHASQCSLGVVRGITVQSVNLVKGIGAAFKTLAGGEIRNYTEMCEKGRAVAFAMMLEQAAMMGATGVAGFRYECNDLMPGTVEVVAYGTALKDGASSMMMPPPTDTMPPQALGNDVAAGGNDVAAGYGAAVALIPSLGRSLASSSVCTTNKIVGQDFQQTLGVVRGITVRSRNIGANIGASIQAAFVGGEIDAWRNLCDTARNDAYTRMLDEATKLGARGIVAMRYETNELSSGITEVLAYGTAVA